MKTLESIQNNFYLSLIENKASDYSFIASQNPEDRLAIYKHTVFDVLRRALKLTYPGIWCLLGEECANNLAMAFCCSAKNLPSSGCLDDWGSEFPRFISEQESLKELFYLNDYGSYEWLKHLSYRAASAEALNLDVLNVISEDCLQSISFTFHPSVYMIKSEYSLDEIETLIEMPSSCELNSVTKKTYGIIVQSNYIVLTHWVKADLWVFVNSLFAGFSLDKAYQSVIINYPQFDLTRAISFVFQKKMIVSVN